METKTKVFYSDFGAVGDGVTEDFHAIKAAHDYANEHNLPVYAEAGKTYYIGDAPIAKREFISIRTTTHWDGAEFILDDAMIPVEHKFPKHIVKGVEVNSEDYINAGDNETTCDRCLKKIAKDPTGCTCNHSGWHTLPVFKIESEYKAENITEQFAGSSLKVGDTCLRTSDGEVWKTGKNMLVKIECDTTRRYIRLGGNEDNGSPQTEILIIDAEGNIDKDTPVTWDYPKFTKVLAKCVDDEPITVGSDNADAYITTYANQGPNYYYMYGRNIKVVRSNVVVQGIKHKIEREGLAEGKCPVGFTQTEYANNVTYKNMRFKRQKEHYDASNKTVLGSYEILAGNCNRLSWINCDQWQFFDPDGGVRYWGFFGSNYCRNYYLENCFLESFDAHCGASNVTIKNSTFEHINCVGHGLIDVENLTVYTDGCRTGITMRGDYGNTWTGEIRIKNLELRSSNLKGAEHQLSVMSSTYFSWANHYFGYTTHMPEKYTLENCRVVKYDYRMENGERIETHTGVNTVPLYICAPLNKFTDVDISDPNADMSAYPNDWRKCECETFNDTDGDGRCNNWIVSRINHGNRVWCWGFKDEPNKARNANPYIPPKYIDIKNCGDLKVVVPPTPQFKNTKVTIDGKEATVAEDGTVIVE